MDIEREIVSYLVKYGNTKESDIVNYGARKFNRSSKDMKKVVDRIVVKGRIHRIVHNKLKPPEVYLSLKESLYPDVLKALIEVDTSEVAEKDAQKILEEAAAIAEKRIREMESREPWLLEIGFEHVCEKDCLLFFRKRKQKIKMKNKR